MLKETRHDGLVFLSIAIIISAVILAFALNRQGVLTGDLNGSLNGSLTLVDSSGLYDSDIIQSYQAAQLLGYQTGPEELITDILQGSLPGIPFTKINNNYIFSRKALEEWIYSRITGSSGVN